ncbi:DUF1428 domain-containing protein [Jannaschia formosa]|uniref:DUF1428 domain-containing protein n=1 Tax=Jannaschia formosa TaxID=2259592 RepID=UPI000E1C0363|nr:DUF1428 domain-containing protein [Jannaschia formosa]TFL18843.1 DUF1428 domain-containing protein [Jannaschia formosa]
MSYFDGFVGAVPAANKQAYVDQARMAWETMFKPWGALSQVEAWGDDVPDGKVTSFPMAVKKEADEVVVFAWIEWPDKATRDTAWGKMMEMGPEAMGDMPFDGKRMIFGGFAPILTEHA